MAIEPFSVAWQGLLVITYRAGSRTVHLFEPAPTARLDSSPVLTKTGQEPSWVCAIFGEENRDGLPRISPHLNVLV
jgi:hypothetical protein